MRSRIERKNPIVLSLLLILISLEVVAAAEPMSLRDFIDEYAKQEGKDIVVDPRLRGLVQLSSELTPGRISAEEFHGVLLTHNWGAFEVEGTIRIVQAAQLKQQKLPYYDGENRNGLVPTQVVNSVIILRARPAEDLVPQLRPLIEQWGYISADPHSNALTVVTTLANVERLIELVDKLDR